MAAYPDLDLCHHCGNKFRPEQVCDACRRARTRSALLWLPRHVRRVWLMVFGDVRKGHGS